MDKRKVIFAYRRGFITLQECAQILGIDSMRVMGMVDEPREDIGANRLRKVKVNG
ncbi:MAG: hypothetical protein J7639_16470 [Paenibacillaceae bacterium]|nr:hypothetical protein [Paenibacillaceae bacterium]